MKRDPQRMLITGAAGAIGAALARSYRARHPGAELILVDYAAAPLETVAQELDAHSSVQDLTDIDALDTWWRGLTNQFGDPDLLINCAGIMDILSFEGTTWPQGRKLLDINLTGPLRLMDLAVPAMMDAGRGWIINLSSMAGRVALRGCSYYGGAKAGLGMASETARMDLRHHGIEVLTVYPGPIWSGLENHARGQVKAGLIRRHIPTGHPDELARRIYRGWQGNKARVIYPDIYTAARYLASLNLTYRTVDLLSPKPHQ